VPLFALAELSGLHDVVPNGEGTNRSRACFSTHWPTSLPRVTGPVITKSHPSPPQSSLYSPCLASLRLFSAVCAGQSYPFPLLWAPIFAVVS
jgi:hypothetical protein